MEEALQQRRRAQIAQRFLIRPMTLLLDTSLWIDFTRARSPAPLKQFIAPYVLDPEAHLAEPVRFEAGPLSPAGRDAPTGGTVRHPADAPHPSGSVAAGDRAVPDRAARSAARS